MEKIKLAILGGGINSAVGPAHISAISMTNNFELVTACFSSNKSINEESFKSYNIDSTKISYDFNQIIAQKENFEILLILTPTNQHYDQIKVCFENEINVISEKSLTVSLANAIELKRIQNGVFLKVIYNYLGYPMLKLIREKINNNVIGEIHQVNIQMPQETFVKLKNGKPLVPQKWRVIDDEIPTVSLDLAVHLHSILKYLIPSQPKRLVAINKSYGHFDVIDNVNSIIEFQNRGICNFSFDKTSLGKRNGLRFEIYGEKGSFLWKQVNPEKLKYINNEGEKFVIDRGSPETDLINDFKISRFKAGHPGGYVEALANYYQNICLDFHNGSSLSYGIEESIEGLSLLSAVNKSSETKRWVDL